MADSFEMTPETLARALANGAKRERRRAAKVLDDRADVELGRGRLDVAQVLNEVAELIRSDDPSVAAARLPETDPSVGEAIVDEPETDGLPPVHHMDDFSEGVALIQGGAHRRSVVGYTGANGHLRD